MTSTVARPRCDVFCRVVDNFGDAAVCWRLARSLAADHGFRVRLWIDRPEVLAALRPAHDGTLDAPLDSSLDRQTLAGIDVCRLPQLLREPLPELLPGADLPDIAIDAFGHGLPEAYAAALALRRPRALWIVLEYLSAEDWATGVHRLASPHPVLDIRRFFFCPGFDADSGGLLRESGLVAARRAFAADAGAQARFRGGPGFAAPAQGSLVVSLFGYANPGLPGLLDSMAAGAQPVRLALAPGPLADAAVDWFAAVGSARRAGPPRAPCEGAGAGGSARAGALEAVWLPLLPQHDYDRLLWASDFNFVRGEDSLVRGIWAGRPLCWQLYPQQDDAQCAKLEAFIDTVGRHPADEPVDGGHRGGAARDPSWDPAWAALQRAWNGCGLSLAERPDAVSAAWQDTRRQLPLLRQCAAQLAGRLAAAPDLATRLAGFCRDQLK